MCGLHKSTSPSLKQKPKKNQTPSNLRTIIFIWVDYLAETPMLGALYYAKHINHGNFKFYTLVINSHKIDKWIFHRHGNENSLRYTTRCGNFGYWILEKFSSLYIVHLEISKEFKIVAKSQNICWQWQNTTCSQQEILNLLIAELPTSMSMNELYPLPQL